VTVGGSREGRETAGAGGRSAGLRRRAREGGPRDAPTITSPAALASGSPTRPTLAGSGLGPTGLPGPSSEGEAPPRADASR
jgi:hypothetical protein